MGGKDANKKTLQTYALTYILQLLLTLKVKIWASFTMQKTLLYYIKGEKQIYHSVFVRLLYFHVHNQNLP